MTNIKQSFNQHITNSYPMSKERYNLKRQMIQLIRPLLTPVLALICAFGLASEPAVETLFLSGKDNENTKTWEFFCTGGRQSGYWTTIEVPSHWEQQGFGEYNYGRDYMTYGDKFKFADEKGMYKYKFIVPKSWKGREINIVFDGSMTDTDVKINGKSAGAIHQGSFYQFKYNITDLLNYGSENLLEATVSKMSTNKSINKAERFADYWIFGGIFRPVYLESFPKEYIDRIAIDAKHDGTFSMNVFPKNISAERNISATIFDQNGNKLKEISGKVTPADSLIKLNTLVSSVQSWSEETPIIYRVKINLTDKSKVLFTTTEKFGFRTIEVRKEQGIFVNGVKVKMKGINRHAFWPETGRCLNNKINLDDIKLIKEMNMNAVRCSHYPPDKIFLDYCDSLGLYVIDELAGWQNAYDTKSGEILVREMVIRDANHPSIIFWSNGNEGGHNLKLDDDYGIYDLSNRPVIHAHHRPGNAFNGIDCNHYEDYYSSKKLIEGPNIYMPTEFLHGQDDGGAAAGLSDYWEMFWKADLAGGGFIWALLDEGVVRTDLNGYIDVNRVNAPDGVLGPHREKEGSFYAIKEIYTPVKITMKSLPDSFDGTIEMENRYFFTNLNKCKFKWKLVDFETPSYFKPGHKINSEGVIAGSDIQPVTKGILKIDLPNDWKKSDALILEAINPTGESVMQWNWQIKNNKEIISAIVKKGNEEVVVKESADSLVLTANKITVFFSKKDGTILGLKNEDSQPLSFKNGPVMVGGQAKLVSFNHSKSENGYTVEIGYEGILKYMRWTMNSSGWLSLEYEYKTEGKQAFSGITFNYPESNIIGVKWLGNGPYRVWKNRMQGGTLDVYEAYYNNTFTGSSPWIYPEFKGYYSDIVWMEFNTVEGKFLVASEDSNLFVRLFEFYSISGPKNLPELPSGNISFLDGIPPTGTKLWTNIYPNASRYGPSGEYYTLDQPVKRKLYFYFGFPEK